MSPDALNEFRCPKCRGELRLVKAATAHVHDELACESCRENFSIVNGIPRFVADQQYAGSFGFQWNKFQRTQLDSYVGLPLSRDRLMAVTNLADDMSGTKILEGGSGAGRFTEVLVATGATVFSFDLSTAVDANSANNSHAPNLQLFQASIFDIPVREQAFDHVVCLGVLQHTPDPERAFKSLAKHVRPGGQISVDVYARRVRAVLAWKYLLRPVTTRMSRDTLLACVEKSVRLLLPMTVLMRRLFGRAGARLFPILDYSHLGLTAEQNREWAVLDTFDMYSPAHDHPRSRAEVRRWFVDVGFESVTVDYGPNGVIARGMRPASSESSRADPRERQRAM